MAFVDTTGNGNKMSTVLHMVRNRNNMAEQLLHMKLVKYNRNLSVTINQMNQERLDVLAFLKQLKSCESDQMSEFDELNKQIKECPPSPGDVLLYPPATAPAVRQIQRETHILPALQRSPTDPQISMSKIREAPKLERLPSLHGLESKRKPPHEENTAIHEGVKLKRTRTRGIITKCQSDMELDKVGRDVSGEVLMTHAVSSDDVRLPLVNLGQKGDVCDNTLKENSQATEEKQGEEEDEANMDLMKRLLHKKSRRHRKKKLISLSDRIKQFYGRVDDLTTMNLTQSAEINQNEDENDPTALEAEPKK